MKNLYPGALRHEANLCANFGATVIELLQPDYKNEQEHSKSYIPLQILHTAILMVIFTFMFLDADLS